MRTVRGHWFPVLVVLIAVSTASAQTLPANVKQTCTVSPTLFKSWFQSGIVKVDGAVKPANSITFSNSPNCDFYRWSQQMFLWLTSPAPSNYGSGRVFDSAAFFDVSSLDSSNHRHFIPHTSGGFGPIPTATALEAARKAGQVIPKTGDVRFAKPGPHGFPVAIDRQGRAFEIVPALVSQNTKRQLVLGPAGQRLEVSRVEVTKDRRAVFFDAAGKQIAQPKAILPPGMNPAKVAQRFFTAQGIPILVTTTGTVLDVDPGQAVGNGVLIAQNGSILFYSITVNDVFANFLSGAKTGGITPAPTQFPTSLTDVNKVIAYATSKGRTIVDKEALAIEVKTSWIDATSLPNANTYVTARMTIPTFAPTSGQVWTKNGTKTVTAALLGIHIAGSTVGHPEMVWATFEHFGNTPNGAYQYVNSANLPQMVVQNTAGTWIVTANNSAGPFNVVRAEYNLPPDLHSPSTSISIGPSNTIRWKAFGAAFNQQPNPLVSAPASNSDIISIDLSVINQLLNGDVRKNYYMIGSTWTIGGAAPTGAFPTGNVVGTSFMSNSTMETYHQGTNNLNTGLTCFDCHISNQTGVSHIYPPLQPLP
ncbi:MAG TPA: hypothetical protein VF381_01515 [Thermoanaerobaculia bacterium]